ncbi:hypothetical protein FHS18_000125 [Paenibacillus phyllosphaerae]|uniref:Uncharacterized protein n=1 Tax=Paenibacillus phyllosphaerae TaxID=274593 RepID=A0A7W5ASZ4_9BACL|nr:hypothetical protein [Paenibacillus phyllosphaerae]MBB3108097.1 hypothetical protein [Paenibacillus phyllosphaerae]
MIKKIALTGTVIVACVTAGLYYPFLGHSEKIVKPVYHDSASYPYFETEQLMGEAEVVAHGVVKQRGKTEIVKIPVTTEIDVTKENEGKFVENVETPITIEVTEIIKGKEKKKNIIYMEEGGELEDRIVEPDGGFLQEGDEVVVFLTEGGHSWGKQGVLRVNKTDNSVVVQENKQEKKLKIDELKTKLKKKNQELQLEDQLPSTEEAVLTEKDPPVEPTNEEATTTKEVH